MHTPLKANWRESKRNRQQADSQFPQLLPLSLQRTPSCPCCLLEAVAELNHRVTLGVYCSDGGKIGAKCFQAGACTLLLPSCRSFWGKLLFRPEKDRGFIHLKSAASHAQKPDTPPPPPPTRASRSPFWSYPFELHILLN